MDKVADVTDNDTNTCENGQENSGTPQFRPDPRSADYIHRQLYHYVRERVRDNFLKPGYMFPGERALAHKYGVSIGTLRRAFEDLRDDGIVRTIPGKGTFIPQPEDGARFAAADTPTSGTARLSLVPLLPPHAVAPVISGSRRRHKRNDFASVSEALRERIVSGDLHDGQPLPTPHQLCDVYGVSPGIAARAIADLKFRGFVTSDADGVPLVRNPHHTVSDSEPIPLDDINKQ